MNPSEPEISPRREAELKALKRRMRILIPLLLVVVGLAIWTSDGISCSALRGCQWSGEMRGMFHNNDQGLGVDVEGYSPGRIRLRIYSDSRGMGFDHVLIENYWIKPGMREQLRDLNKFLDVDYLKSRTSKNSYEALVKIPLDGTLDYIPLRVERWDRKWVGGRRKRTYPIVHWITVLHVTIDPSTGRVRNIDFQEIANPYEEIPIPTLPT